MPFINNTLTCAEILFNNYIPRCTKDLSDFKEATELEGKTGLSETEMKTATHN